MLRCLRRLLVAGLCALMLVVGFEVAAEASVARVSGVEVKGQSWCAAKLRIRWKAVSGATYQVRWASSKTRLGAARTLPVRRNVASVGPLSVTGTTYLQVRAVRAGKLGAWSRIRAARFSTGWPSAPRLSGSGVAGGVRFTWPCVTYASRYRVRWAAAPYGKWPATTNYVSGWLGASVRSSTFRVPATPQSGDHMLGVAYANPVWGRLEAGNSNGGVRLSTGWVPVFPAPPNPGTGDGVRIGTYNVMLSPGAGSRVNAIAANISSHNLSVVALQEANLTTAKAVVAALGSGWAYADSGTDAMQQVLYRTASYREDVSGTFNVRNARAPGTPLVTPWVRLTPVSSASPGHGRPFYVVSAHIQENPDKSAMDKKRDAGLAAGDVMNGINAVNGESDPVVVAGDLRYLREPWSDVPGYVEGPPTLVRGGYYDAMAALRKTNFQYPTFNGGTGTTSQRQTPAQSGVAPRADYVMLKGFRGSNAYVNVANWASSTGIVPSDHNLVYVDVTVPFAP
jgi:endonuclease/exonuclease/phosphatase family metal-dependent hydrolase